jgi:hypothetical protein
MMFRLACSANARSLHKAASRGLAIVKATTYKSSTGLVGLDVDANGRDTLSRLSQEVLRDVKVANSRSSHETCNEFHVSITHHYTD